MILVVKNLKIQLSNQVDDWSYDYTITIDSNKINCLGGDTGSGKTTFMLALAGLLATESGQIMIDSKPIHSLAPNRRPINIMFQENNLMPSINVFENIGLGLERKIKKSEQYQSRLNNFLQQFGIYNLRKSPCIKLSGGQKQLVALLRVIMRSLYKNYENFEKQLILLDEPLVGLDFSFKNHVFEVLKSEVAANGHLILFSTHETKLLHKAELERFKIYKDSDNTFRIKNEH